MILWVLQDWLHCVQMNGHYVYEDEVSDDCWSCNRTACKSEPSFVLIWRHQKHKDFAYCDIGSRVRLESEPLMYQASASRENSKQFNAVKKYLKCNIWVLEATNSSW